jgi:hypothetical protein
MLHLIDSSDINSWFARRMPALIILHYSIMKPIFLTSLFFTCYAGADCVLPGLQKFAVQNGLAPECGLVGSQGYIALHGDTRFSWSSLRVGAGEQMSGLQITGSNASVHVVRGQIYVGGAITSQGPLAIFGAAISTAPTGSISAPELVVSAALPANDEDVDGYFSNTTVVLETTPAADTNVPGLVSNQGVLKATVGNLTVLGGEIQNAGSQAAMVADGGTVRLVAADKMRASRAQVNALNARPGLGNVIYNKGTIRGFHVEMRSVPQSCFDEDCFSINYVIVNQGKIKGTAKVKGVLFDVSGADDDVYHGAGVVENRDGQGDPTETGTLVTPDFQPLLDNHPDYVKGGILVTTTRQVQPNDGDDPQITPTRFNATNPADKTVSVPLLPNTSAAGVILKTQPDHTSAQAGAAGTRGVTTATAEEDKKKSKRPKPIVVRGAFFGTAVRN